MRFEIVAIMDFKCALARPSRRSKPRLFRCSTVHTATTTTHASNLRLTYQLSLCDKRLLRHPRPWVETHGYHQMSLRDKSDRCQKNERIGGREFGDNVCLSPGSNSLAKRKSSRQARVLLLTSAVLNPFFSRRLRWPLARVISPLVCASCLRFVLVSSKTHWIAVY